MENGRVRISDIAEELGLSSATVSNVIHGKTKKVSEETIKRVQELVEKRGYIPSMAGILLAQNHSGIIGIMVNDHEKYEGHALEDGFISASVNALSKEIDRTGRFMMVKVTKRWEEIVRFASMWNMEGLVIIGFCERDYQKLRESMHIPFVVYDGYFRGQRAKCCACTGIWRLPRECNAQQCGALHSQEARRICNLTIDNYGGGYQAGRYLKEMGHRKVLCITDNFVCMDLERIKGCVEAMGEEAVSFLEVPMKKEERMRLYREREAEILEYTAVFAMSDFYAAELIHYLQERKKRVPEDISVVGFDDSPLCAYCSPELTTIRQDADARARTAISVLRNLREGTEERSTIKMPVSLVKRGSVKRISEPEK